ncbi:MAG: hypothetical protein KY445_05835 [Armatimonadetes bacterium]|nr:hypothetical protein [Armatimonadota bacterium]
MEWMFAVTLGGAALFYIASPLWAGASPSKRAAQGESWHTVEQLEIDRDLGKIDDAEFEELKPELPAPSLPSLESLIFGARRQKRLETSLESEVLIARARKKK